MSKRLGGIIDCNDKTSSWHLNGFSDGSNVVVWACFRQTCLGSSMRGRNKFAGNDDVIFLNK